MGGLPIPAREGVWERFSANSVDPGREAAVCNCSIPCLDTPQRLRELSDGRSGIKYDLSAVHGERLRHDGALCLMVCLGGFESEISGHLVLI